MGHGDTQALALSPDGHILAAQGPGQTLWLWDVATRRPLRELKGSAEWMGALVFSPDARTVLAGAFDGRLKFYNLACGVEVTSIQAHRSICQSISITPDGTRVVTAGVDDAIKVWFAPTFDEIDKPAEQ